MSKKIILHVEDDADEAFILRRAFLKADLAYEIHQVTDGEQAIAYLGGLAPFDQRGRHPLPQVILLDLKLPGKGGFEVLSWVRAQREFNGLPIIVLTSSDRPEDLRHAQALGATAYLNKSVSCRNIIELLGTMA